ncbi:MAG: hypothetical protein ACREOU_04200, partial [Candidatus Eiseniibacteriota bacterium]
MHRFLVVVSALVALLSAPSLGTSYANAIVNSGFEIAEPTAGSLPTSAGDWNGFDTSAIVTAENGITPYEGTRMLHFINSAIGPGPAGASEVIQLVDVSSLASVISTGTARGIASYRVNRIAGDAQTDSEFRIEIYAYSGSPASFPAQFTVSELATAFQSLVTDGNPATWQTVSVDLTLPPTTTFVAIIVSAAENVFNDAVNPEFDGHYADVASFSVVDAQPYTIRYEASSGDLPDDSCPAWTRDQTGGTASVSGGILTMSSGVQNHVLNYHVPVSFANPIVAEFRARRITGTTSSAAREHLGIAIGTSTGVGVHFFVGPDVVFLTNGPGSRGPQAFVDTDAMHTFRIEVSGSAVSVYYDNVLTLAGSTFSSGEFPAAGITWGDFTNLSDGVSEWEYFQHNSSALACNPVTTEPASSCISAANPCVSIPVSIARTDAAPLRGYSVTFTLSANLMLCGPIGANITQGPYLATGAGANGTTYLVLNNGGGSYTVDEAILGTPCGAGGAGGGLFTIKVMNSGGDGLGTITINSVTLRDCSNAPIPADL